MNSPIIPALAVVLTWYSSNVAAQNCEISNQLIWSATERVGISKMTNVGFGYSLQQDTIERLVDIRVDKRREEEQKKGQFFSEAQWAQYRELVAEDTRSFGRRVICFDAIRIDPSFIEVELVDAVREINRKIGGGSTGKIDTVGGKTGAVSLEYNVQTLLEASSLDEAPIAIVNAGWSAGISSPEPLGFLRVGGETINDAYYPGLSAILCLRRETSEQGQIGHLAEISVFFSQNEKKYAFNSWYVAPQTNWEIDYRERFSLCTDAVQVGPRIIEKDNFEYFQEYQEEMGCFLDVRAIYGDAARKVGICERALLGAPRIRSVIASDLVNGNAKSGEGFIYLLSTTNPVSLFDLQHMFLRSQFTDNRQDFWAVNLAGDSQAFHYYTFPSRGPVRYGLKTSLYSAFRLVARADN